ncbi:lycopene cyclase domain-containing protein [Glutamicibacter arilaitensis]|uniref:lycopene cyclase domain-containing protein n=1 Tax=Glutamicibacter arilaitensis TaxID=256701 RepID=UPI00385181B3
MGLVDARFKLFVFDKPLAALACLGLGTAFFLVWDVIAIAQGIFLHLDSGLMTGLMVAEQLPLEEVFFLFFLCYSTMIVVNGISLLRRSVSALRPTREGANDVS